MFRLNIAVRIFESCSCLAVPGHSGLNSILSGRNRVFASVPAQYPREHYKAGRGVSNPTSRFAGGTDPQGIGFIPNITANRLNTWTQADIVEMLTTG